MSTQKLSIHINEKDTDETPNTQLKKDYEYIETAQRGNDYVPREHKQLEDKHSKVEFSKEKEKQTEMMLERNFLGNEWGQKIWY